MEANETPFQMMQRGREGFSLGSTRDRSDTMLEALPARLVTVTWALTNTHSYQSCIILNRNSSSFPTFKILICNFEFSRMEPR
jgi:hypothetical protein